MPLPKALHAGSPVLPSGGLAPLIAPAAPAGGAAAVAPGKGGYPFAMQTQTEDNWCWAAVATSTSLHYDLSSPWTQCGLANSILPLPSGVDCCISGAAPPQCDVEWYLDKALTATSNLLEVRAGTVGFAKLTALLDGDRPLAIRIEWAGGGGHFVVFHQWEKTASGTEFVVVADPFYGGRTLLYNDCVHRYPATRATTGKWTHSYWTQP
jgi:hypothetical protein